MTDESLVIQTKQYVKQERALLKQVLCNLKEIEIRKLYLKRGYSSMFTFCTRALGYSESAAQRRIDAMRAFKEIPEIADKIAEGKLSLSCVAMVQKTLRRESKNISKNKIESINATINITKKKELFKSIESKSQRQVEQVLVQQFPQSQLLNKPDITRAITPEKSEIKFIADEELIKKLKQIKSLYSHKNINPSYNELLHLMADQILKKQMKKTVKACKAKSEVKMAMKAQKQKAARKKTMVVDGPEAVKRVTKKLNLQKSNNTKTTEQCIFSRTAPSQQRKILNRSRYIKKSVRREIYSRDNGKCQYVDPFTKTPCNSEHLIQIDHIKAYSNGGGADIDNLQLLCAGHNQLKSNK